jgi:hypothetical protein
MASTCAFVDAYAKGDDHGNHTDRKLPRGTGLTEAANRGERVS